MEERTFSCQVVNRMFTFAPSLEGREEEILHPEQLELVEGAAVVSVHYRGVGVCQVTLEREATGLGQMLGLLSPVTFQRAPVIEVPGPSAWSDLLTVREYGEVNGFKPGKYGVHFRGSGVVVFQVARFEPNQKPLIPARVDSWLHLGGRHYGVFRMGNRSVSFRGYNSGAILVRFLSFDGEEEGGFEQTDPGPLGFDFDGTVGKEYVLQVESSFSWELDCAVGR